MQNTTTRLPDISIFITKIIISGRRRNERDERRREKEDRDVGDGEGNEQEAQKPSLYKEKKERPPPRSLCRHCVEDRAPDVRFDKVPIVFVETFARATIMAHDFQSLADLKVIIERSFILVLERGEDFGIVPV